MTKAALMRNPMVKSATILLSLLLVPVYLAQAGNPVSQRTLQGRGEGITLVSAGEQSAPPPRRAPARTPATSNGRPSSSTEVAKSQSELEAEARWLRIRENGDLAGSWAESQWPRSYADYNELHLKKDGDGYLGYYHRFDRSANERRFKISLSRPMAGDSPGETRFLGKMEIDGKVQAVDALLQNRSGAFDIRYEIGYTTHGLHFSPLRDIPNERNWPLRIAVTTYQEERNLSLARLVWASGNVAVYQSQAYAGQYVLHDVAPGTPFLDAVYRPDGTVGLSEADRQQISALRREGYPAWDRNRKTGVGDFYHFYRNESRNTYSDSSCILMIRDLESPLSAGRCPSIVKPFNYGVAFQSCKRQYQAARNSVDFEGAYRSCEGMIGYVANAPTDRSAGQAEIKEATFILAQICEKGLRGKPELNCAWHHYERYAKNEGRFSEGLQRVAVLRAQRIRSLVSQAEQALASKDRRRAFELFRAANQYGHVASTLRIARLVESGNLILSEWTLRNSRPPYRDEARGWYQRAAGLGSEEAKRWVEVDFEAMQRDATAEQARLIAICRTRPFAQVQRRSSGAVIGMSIEEQRAACIAEADRDYGRVKLDIRKMRAEIASESPLSGDPDL